MRQIHSAGEKVFIDYSGDTVAVIDAKRARSCRHAPTRKLSTGKRRCGPGPRGQDVPAGQIGWERPFFRFYCGHLSLFARQFRSLDWRASLNPVREPEKGRDSLLRTQLRTREEEETAMKPFGKYVRVLSYAPGVVLFGSLAMGPSPGFAQIADSGRSEPLRLTIAPGNSSRIAMKTMPKAVCLLHEDGVSDTGHSFKLLSDDEGIIRFNVKPSDALMSPPHWRWIAVQMGSPAPSGCN